MDLACFAVGFMKCGKPDAKGILVGFSAVPVCPISTHFCHRHNWQKRNRNGILSEYI